MAKNKIIPQMFDVRPVDETGDLDWQKIQAVGQCGFAAEEIEEQQQPSKHETRFERPVNAYILGTPIESQRAPILHDPNFNLERQLNWPWNEEETPILEQPIKISEFEKKDNIKELLRAREEKIRQEKLREQERLAQFEKQKQLFQQQEKERREQQAKLLSQQKEKEEMLQSQRDLREQQRQEKVRQEALARQEELKKIVEENRRQQEIYQAQVLAEREQREKEYQAWLANELEQQEKQKLIAQKSLKALQKKSKKKTNWFLSKKQRSPKVAKASHDLQGFAWSDLFATSKLSFQFDARASLVGFVAVALVLALSVGSISYASKGLGLKGKVLGASQDGYEDLTAAVGDMAHQNFQGSTQNFDKAFANFSEGSQDLEDMGGILLDATKYIPFVSKISSGKNAVEAGKHFSAAGQALNEVVKTASSIKNPIASGGQDVSMLDVLESSEKNIAIAKTELDAAQKNIDSISINDLPEDKRDKFLLLKQKLPDIRSAMDFFLNNSHILVDLLGGNGPRKYLFLFQNNSEMRATGGFIGSYGLMDISNGHVKKFFIDGIFNPDGQLKDKIVPPFPIQKISANWSMHDSNWFPDFPLSAQKAINFYEKTGGPTADGVIAFTPTVMQKLLEITGPIEMPDYGVTLDNQNFIELTQYKVEVDYDKEENKPKKILSDLAPLILEKLLSSKDLNTISKTAQAFMEGLQEKHILLYSENKELENIISQQGWSGEMLPASKDYLSVINTNINGFKTDAIIDESISHKAEIQADGSVVDTVTVTRKHNGGNTPYEWLNKVNADYMRVYVPEGSKLLEVNGQTREEDKAPLDYDALGFKRDADVVKEESGIAVDPQSGTRIYEENGKTVFANWTYVSPGESMTITYKYLLPFSLFKVSVGDAQIDSYSLVAQKQSGSVGSSFDSEITFPANYVVDWNFPDDAQKNVGQIKSSTDLKTDKFEGVVFEKK